MSFALLTYNAVYLNQVWQKAVYMSWELPCSEQVARLEHGTARQKERTKSYSIPSILGFPLTERSCSVTCYYTCKFILLEDNPYKVHHSKIIIKVQQLQTFQFFTYLIWVGIKGEAAFIQLHVQFSKRKSQRWVLIVYGTVTPSGFTQSVSKIKSEEET